MRTTKRQSSIFFVHNVLNSATIGVNSGDKSGNSVLTDELAPIINKLSGSALLRTDIVHYQTPDLLKVKELTMKERIGPWVPAIYCGAIAITTTIANLSALRSGGSGGATNFVFILFLPMAFFFVGVHLSKLQHDNTTLRERIDAISKQDAG